MTNNLKRRGLLLLVMVGTLLAGAVPAFAVDPTPPADATATAASALANFGDAAIGVFGDLVTNVWVLAIFAFGIAIAFASAVIRRIRGRASQPIG